MHESVAAYGYPSLFILSFLASTLIPLGSEWLLVTLLLQRFDPVTTVAVATAAAVGVGLKVAVAVEVAVGVCVGVGDGGNGVGASVGMAFGGRGTTVRSQMPSSVEA